MSGKNKAKLHHEYKNTMDYYESKLSTYPNMPRYSHYVAVLSGEMEQTEKADAYFRQSLVDAPNNIMVRNDFAVYLHDKRKNKQDAIKELKKTTLLVENNALVQKNLGAIIGNTGQYREGLKHATQSYHLNPNDAVNHRNLGKLHATLGDNYSSLHHNLTSIQLVQQQLARGIIAKPNTNVYRTAAVQLISKGGNREEALKLVAAARTIEGKHIDLPTSTRTYEIIAKVKARQGDKVAALEKERQEELDKLKKVEASILNL
eukprot:gene8451-11429_t